jgi:hypothetical protein
MADRSEEFRRVVEICQSETAKSFSSDSLQQTTKAKDPSPFTVQCNTTYSHVRDNEEVVKKMERL